jgi:hypothetical protein
MSLGIAQESFAELENIFAVLPARDGHRLATSRLQDVLAMEVWARCCYDELRKRMGHHAALRKLALATDRLANVAGAAVL